MLAAILALCLSAGGALTDHVSVWEHNTVVCGKTGQPQLTQEIFWRVEERDGVTDWFVADWRLSSNVNTLPVPIRGEWVGTFRDKKDGVWRTIRAAEYWDTESNADFELIDRVRLPTEKRSGLKKK